MSEKIISFFKRNYFNILCIFLIIMMVFIIIFDIVLYFELGNDNYEENSISSNINNNIEQEKIDNIKVEIKGMVNNPGVYSLSADSRVIDLIEKAGGLIEGANTELINLSKKLVDEMVIVIYSNDFINNYKENNKKIEYVYVEVESCPDNINSACINEYENSNINDNDEKNDQLVKNTKISINTALVDELTTLSGIGQSKAEAIIKYREENGKFTDISDIKNVSGIGESAFEKIKDNITI